MSSRLTLRARNDFILYLRQCTDAQVQGVYDKERYYGHRQEVQMAEAEAHRRGIMLDYESWRNYLND